MNRMVMQIIQGTGMAVLFLAAYTALNTLAVSLFPEWIYYFAVVHVLLIPYTTAVYTLTTYYRSNRNKDLTQQTFLYSLVGSSVLIGTYFFFPEPSYYIKMVAIFVLPFIAVYNYFRFNR